MFWFVCVQFPRAKDTSFTGVTVEECRMLLATGEDFLSSRVCNSYVHQCCIYLIKMFKITTFFYDGKAEFSTAITHYTSQEIIPIC